MKAIYCRRSNPISLLMRSVLWSSWSHCGLVTPQGTVIEAAAFHGVREVRLADFLDPVSKHAIKDIEVPDDEAAIRWARSQIGKPYDWLGALGLGLHRDWQGDDSWFCSEFLEQAAAAGGRQRFINQPRRVTPQHSWMVA